MSPIKRSLFASSMLIALAAASGAFAQSAMTTAPKAPDCKNNPTPDCPPASMEIVVTGSRISRVDLAAPQPVSIMAGQDIRDRGYTNLADAINQMPDLGAGITPIGDQNDFGVGRNYIDMFGLGSNRTLVLVSGLRFVGDNPSNLFANNGGNQVDLNALPTLLVDRIDEVPATGAAVYGSDAVSGVVNIIMKQKYVGAEVSAQAGISTYGDAPRYTVEALVGRNFFGDRLNVAVDLQYDRTNPLTQANRSYTASQNGFFANPNYTGPGSVPASIVEPNARFSGATVGGLPFSPNFSYGQSDNGIYLMNPNGTLSTTLAQFGKNGNLVPFNPGNLYADSFFGGNASGGDSLNVGPLSELQTPLDRKNATIIASFEITPHITAYANVFYSQNQALETIGQPNYADIAFGPPSPGSFNAPIPGLALDISADNAFLTPQAKATLAANGVTEFFLSRANTDVTPDPINSYVNTINASLKFVGDFSFINRTFNWDTSYVHGVSYSSFYNDYLNYGNATLPNKFGYALDSVIGPNGTPVCRVQTQPIPAGANAATIAAIQSCVPFDPFGANNNSAAVKRYITASFGDKAKNEQDDFQANMNTTLFKLPAGDLKVAAGFEYRRERASFSPDLASAEGIGYSVPITGQVGEYHTDEFYGEVNLPLLGPGFNLPFAQKFEVEGAYRNVQNSLAGNNRSWSVGGQFSPVPDITLRGSRSNTFRAPSLQELTSANTNAYDSGSDPCQVSNITAGPNPAVRQANCAKEFASIGANLATFTDSTVSNATIPVTAGGNPNLKNEIGDSYTYGLVLQPRFVPGLTLAMDYIHIDITDAIEYYGVGQLMESCYDSPTYPSTACSLFQRQPGTGQVISAQETFVNDGFTHFAAMKYTFDYVRKIADLPFLNSDRDLGRAELEINGINNRQQVTSVSGLGFDDINTAGTIDTPRWRWNGELIYTRGPLHASWTTHYISASAYDLTYTSSNQEPLKIKDNVTHDLSISYKVTPWLTARLNVNNIFNQAPPSPVGTYSVGYYDFIGRYFLFGLDGKF